MRVLVLLTVLLAGCASTPEEQYVEWEECVVVAKAEGRDGSSRPECDKIHEQYLRRLESELVRERGRPTCPDGLLSHCQGLSCGRSPRTVSDYKDYHCVSQRAYKEWLWDFTKKMN